MRRRLKKGFWIAAGSAGLFLAGDALYALMTAQRFSVWDRKQSRDEQGILSGGRAWSMGEGDHAVLFIHGFADVPAVFLPMGKALADQSYHCRAMRLPGAGERPAPAQRFTDEDWQAKVGEEVEQLRSRHTGLFIVAHSMGSAVALRYVLEHPGEVDGLVLIAPLVEVSDARSPALSPETWHRLSERVLIFSHMYENVFQRDMKTGVAEVPKDRFVPRKTYQNLFHTLHCIRDRAREVTCPIKMILANGDPVVDNAAALDFLERSRARRKEVKVWKHVGHVIPLDAEPERLSQTVHDFIMSEKAAAGHPDTESLFRSSKRVRGSGGSEWGDHP